MCSTDQEQRNTAPRGPNRTIHGSHGNGAPRIGPRAADTIFRAVRGSLVFTEPIISANMVLTTGVPIFLIECKTVPPACVRSAL